VGGAIRTLVIAAVLICTLPGCTSLYFKDAGAPPSPPPRYALDDWPYSEYWTGIIFNGQKVGYAHVQVVPSAERPGSYDIRSQSLLHIRMLGYDKRIALESVDRVAKDLTLEWFSHHYDLDGNRLEIEGEVQGNLLTAQVENAGRSSRIERTLDAPVYPASAMTLVPVYRGLRIGDAYRYPVFSAETQTVESAEQKIEAYEKSEFFDERAYRVSSGLLGLTSTTWLSDRGLPLLELALGGVIISAISTEERAKRFIATTAINKDDAIIGFSLIKSDVAIAHPRELRRLDVSLSGNPALTTVASDARQRCRRAGDALSCEIRAEAKWPEAVPPAVLRSALRDSLAVPSDDDRIRTLAHQIAGSHSDPDRQIDALMAWMRHNIRNEAADSFSALDVLRTRAAECQGHAFLYAALARALGIPTRVVNGVVYAPEYGGFLFHAWNESWVGDGWVAIDTTLDQRPADATHIKLVYGENVADLVSLAGWVGKMQIRVLDQGS
jgi:transglutaminase-like putative cysteine protease